MADKPSSSVIFNWKRWIPVDRFFTMDLGKAESTIEDEAGPEILDHKYLLIIPSGSFDKLPSSEILSTGKTIIVSLPAFAIGGLLISRQVSHSVLLRQEI